MITKDSIQAEVHNNPEDPWWTGLYDKIREYIANYEGKIDLLRHINRPDTTPFPDELAAAKGVFYSGASRQLMRKYADEAPVMHRRPLRFSTWKPLIDEITGSDCVIFQGNKLRKAFVLGFSELGGADTMDPSVDFQPVGGRLFDPGLGYIMIDLGTGAMVSDEIIADLVERLAPLSNIYMFVEVGYVVTVSSVPFTIGTSLIGPPALIGESVDEQQYFVPQRRL